MALNDLINIISSVNGSLEKVTIQGDSTMRGEQGKPPSSGIYIRRNGSVSGSASGKNLTITLEGGSTKWAGSINEDGVLPYFTPAQMMVVGGIKRYLNSRSNAYIEEDYYGK